MVTKTLPTTGTTSSPRVMVKSGQNETEHPDLMCWTSHPHKNGYQVCRQLKNPMRPTKNIKIILLTVKTNRDRFWGMKQVPMPTSPSVES